MFNYLDTVIPQVHYQFRINELTMMVDQLCLFTFCHHLGLLRPFKVELLGEVRSDLLPLLLLLLHLLTFVCIFLLLERYLALDRLGGNLQCFWADVGFRWQHQ